MTCPITRRDFVNGALVGTGAALVAGCGSTATTEGPLSPSGSAWTGYGGTGDYAWANGNTEVVVNAAHGIRDGKYPDVAGRAVDETVDLLVVGGGFSGLTSAWEFNKNAAQGKTCLVLDNHPVMGGEAKQNEFIVDGRRLTAPQGSNGALLLKPGFVSGTFDGDTYNVFAGIYSELGLPSALELEPVAGAAKKFDIPNYHFSPMAPASERGYETGYHFPDKGWVLNPSRNGFAETPWPANVQKELDDYIHGRRDVLKTMPNAEAWLDTVTYYDLLDKQGYGPEVRKFVDPYIAVSNYGVSGSGISAYAAHKLRLPGTALPPKPEDAIKFAGAKDVGVISFPGGNAAILRAMVARMIPGAIKSDGSTAQTASGAIDFTALDKPGQRVRVRLGSTAIDVRHDGDPKTAGSVLVTYVRDGKIRRVRAKAVVMGSGGWVNRNIVRDLSPGHADAYREFHYGPVLTANVAVRNWRFFDKLGFINARWFDGLGWQVSARRNLAFNSDRPLTPDEPMVLTFYIPILRPDLPGVAQGPAARLAMFETSYADYERQIRERMQAMFAVGGFDAKRDIAGIVLNRWGHAFCAPQPGFYLGKDGGTPPPDVIRQPHGRIAFAHSELNGGMTMAHGMKEAHRGAGQALEML